MSTVRCRLLLAPLLTLTLLAGCASAPPPLPDPNALDQAPPVASPLDGIDWQLVQLSGQWVILADTGRTPTLRFDGVAQKASGFDGCNRFNGRLRVLGSHLRIGPLASTRMACPASMAPERAFVVAVESTVHWQRQQDLLELLDAAGQPLLLLRAGP